VVVTVEKNKPFQYSTSGLDLNSAQTSRPSVRIYFLMLSFDVSQYICIESALVLKANLAVMITILLDI